MKTKLLKKYRKLIYQKTIVPYFCWLYIIRKDIFPKWLDRMIDQHDVLGWLFEWYIDHIESVLPFTKWYLQTHSPIGNPYSSVNPFEKSYQNLISRLCNKAWRESKNYKMKDRSISSMFPISEILDFKFNYKKYSKKYWEPETVLRRVIKTGSDK